MHRAFCEEILTHNAPFPWQKSLFLRSIFERFPADVSLPTGNEKTFIMAIWLLALAKKLLLDSRQNAIPRRLIWVVNRRVIVDQATSEAGQLRQRVYELAGTPIRSAKSRLLSVSSIALQHLPIVRTWQHH
jgi:CRISPR-associated endonuclease/helicase Cas3